MEQLPSPYPVQVQYLSAVVGHKLAFSELPGLQPKKQSTFMFLAELPEYKVALNTGIAFVTSPTISSIVRFTSS